ncbi:MAG: hypothetical protein PHY47_25815 [Lachnospiraceae bacterium]|nr:hypothetical protein [Lachnospiraceae bacterium]
MIIGIDKETIETILEFFIKFLGGGFCIMTLFDFLSYGIFRAFSLANIKK